MEIHMVRKFMVVFFTMLALVGCEEGYEEVEVNDEDINIKISGLVDSRVQGAKETNATWNLHSFSWNDERVKWNADFNYENNNVQGLTYKDGVVFVQLEGKYHYKTKKSGEGLPAIQHKSFTDIIPVKCEGDRKDQCTFQFEQSLEEITRETESQYLDDLGIKMGWVQIYENNEGRLYVQWAQADGDNMQQPIVFNESNQEITGEFLTYQTQGEGETGRITSLSDFRYVKWIKEHMN